MTLSRLWLLILLEAYDSSDLVTLNTRPRSNQAVAHQRSAASTRAGLPRETSYHHGSLRDQLITMGTALLDEGGTSALSLREVARRVGVSQTAPGHHFGDRAGLLAAISARGFMDLTEQRLARLKSVSDAEQQLRIAMLAYVEFAVTRPALFHLMFGPEIPDKRVYPELSKASLGSYRLLTNVVARYLEREGIAANAGSVAFSIWSAAHGLATLLIDQQQAPDFVETKTVALQCEALANLLIMGLGSATKDI